MKKYKLLLIIVGLSLVVVLVFFARKKHSDIENSGTTSNEEKTYLEIKSNQESSSLTKNMLENDDSLEMILTNLDVEFLGVASLELELKHPGISELYRNVLNDFQQGNGAERVDELVDIGLEFIYPAWDAITPSGKVDVKAIHQSYLWAKKILNDIELVRGVDETNLTLNRLRILTHIRKMERIWGDLIPEIEGIDSTDAEYEVMELSALRTENTVDEAMKQYLMLETQASHLGQTIGLSYLEQLAILEHPQSITGRNLFTARRIEIFRLIRQAEYLKQHPALIGERKKNYYMAEEIIQELTAAEFIDINVVDRIYLERISKKIADERSEMEN